MLVSIGLMAIAFVCAALLASGFVGRAGPAKVAKPKPRVLAVVHSTTSASAATSTTETASTIYVPPPTEPPTTVATPPTSAASTTTTTSTTAPRTTTTAPPVTAAASVSDQPKFCTVTVRLSTGQHASYALDQYLVNIGDTYVFTAVLGGYRVDVLTKVVSHSGSPECSPSLSRLGHT